MAIKASLNSSSVVVDFALSRPYEIISVKMFSRDL